MSDDEISLEGGLFQEPEDYYKPAPEAHFVKHIRKHLRDEHPSTNTEESKAPKGLKGPGEITLRLVGQSPLWGHLLWNAGIFTADYLDEHADTLVKNKRVLELGAAAALPSLVASLNGAKEVVSTDYPDPELISNIEWNFSNLEKDAPGVVSPYKVKGYIWGNEAEEVVYDNNNESVEGATKEIPEELKFDLIILSDVVFNHTEHHKLLKTCRTALKRDGKCLVVFSPHRPWLLENDLEFFTTCEEYQLKAEKIDLVVWKPMFEEDEETAEIRSRVYSFFLNPQWD